MVKTSLVLISLCALVFGEWVEIPQFSKKSYIVTPYTPYIYDKPTYFTSTTPDYSVVFRPEVHDFTEQKKSITKVPDSVIRKVDSTTTPMSPMKRYTLKPPRTSTIKPKPIKPNKKLNNQGERNNDKRNNKPKNNGNNNRRNNSIRISNKLDNNFLKLNRSTTTTTPKNIAQQVFEDEAAYDGDYVYNDNDYDENDEYINDNEGGDMSDDGQPLPDEEYYDDEYEYYDDDEETLDRKSESSEKGDTAGYSYIGFLPYLKTIQSTLMRNSHKTTKSKVSFLTEIKDRLLYAIKEKISSIWSPLSRQARSTRGDHYYYPSKKDSHDMDFPSNEGPLLTIGFLTFAVFLIKGILKLIYALKGHGGGKGGGYKKVIVVNMNQPMATSTMMTTFRKFESRYTESPISDEQSAKMLDLLDTYKYK